MTLPIKIQPQTGEAFTSWFARLCHANGATVRQVSRIIAPDMPSHHLLREMTGSPPLQLVHSLTETTGLTQRQLLDTTTRNALGRRKRHEDTPTAELLVSSDHIRYHGINFCPQCLQDSDTFLVTWRNSFTLVCPTHEALMQSICPACHQVPTGLPWHPGSARPSLEGLLPVPGTCQAPIRRGGACDFPLAQAEPSASPPAWTDWLRLQMEVVLLNIGAICLLTDSNSSAWEFDLLVRELKLKPPSIKDVCTLVPETETPEILNPYAEFLAAHEKRPVLAKRYIRKFTDPDRTIPRPEVMLVLSATAIKLLTIVSPASPYSPLPIAPCTLETYKRSFVFERLRGYVSESLAEVLHGPLRFQNRVALRPDLRTRHGLSLQHAAWATR